MARFPGHVLTVWHAVVLASLLAWLVGGSPPVQAHDLAWATSMGSRSGDSIAVDGAGNSYVTGYFSGTATFGKGEAHETILKEVPRVYWHAVFLAKYDQSGRLAWAKKVEGIVTRESTKVAVDGTGHSYLTGNFKHTVTFGAGEAHEMTLTSTGAKAVFVATYDGDGQLRWATHTNGTVDSALGGGIAVDEAGNSYITGVFFKTATFGPGEAQETTLISAGKALFVATYDSDGRRRWAIPTNGTIDSAVGGGIAVDGAGNSYVTGRFGSPVTFGLGEPQETTLESLYPWTLFVATYDSSGRLRWARSVVSAAMASLGGMGVDRVGDSYIIGNVLGAATFGVGEAHETTLGGGIFVVKYDASGTPRWARQVGGGEVRSAAVDGAGHSYMTGFFSGTTTFGNANAYHIALVARKKDIFVAKFGGGLPFVVLANTKVTLDRPGASKGAIMSNGALEFLPGPADTPSVFTGDLKARNDITIHPGNAILGTATARGLVTVLPGATVTDAVVADARVPVQALPLPTFTAGGLDQTVPAHGLLALEPGTYGHMAVDLGGTLHLRSGDYFVQTLALGKRAQLVVEVTDGPVRLHVVEQLAISKKARVTLTPVEAASDLLTITTLQITRLTIGDEAQVVGTLLAPYAPVRVGLASQFTGALIADKVTVQPGAVLRPHGAVSSVP